MGDLSSLQGCHGPMIRRIQELAQVVCEKSVEYRAQRVSLLKPLSSHSSLQHLVTINKDIYTVLIQSRLIAGRPYS